MSLCEGSEKLCKMVIIFIAKLINSDNFYSLDNDDLLDPQIRENECINLILIESSFPVIHKVDIIGI